MQLSPNSVQHVHNDGLVNRVTFRKDLLRQCEAAGTIIVGDGVLVIRKPVLLCEVGTYRVTHIGDTHITAER